MAESGPDNQSSASGSPVAEFGANEWLVDEMFERYQEDPQSVDSAWLAYFEGRSEDTSDASDGGSNGSGPAAKKSAPATKSSGSTAREARHEAGLRPRRSGVRVGRQGSGHEGGQLLGGLVVDEDVVGQVGPGHEGRRSGEAGGGQGVGGQAGVASSPPRSRRRCRRRPRPLPRRTPATSRKLTVLRGAPMRTAQNMDISLTVPTATSVRTVPVKLLWDNRIVINNHLARARGGKVSFTHVIGYALVKALRSMPEMNNGFDIIDGKPNLIQPAHINLGLAIDLPKEDGTRQLLVPSIKGAETMDFAEFWTAYEELIRKARGGKLGVIGLPGHHHQPDQPRHHRHQPLGAAPDEGPGLHPRRRLDGLPAGVPGRLRGDPHPQRGQQGDDADLDVRPPGHPGRAVG